MTAKPLLYSKSQKTNKRLLITLTCLATLPCSSAFLPGTALAGSRNIKEEPLRLLEPKKEATPRTSEAKEASNLQLEYFSLPYAFTWSDATIDGTQHQGNNALGWNNWFRITWEPWENGQLFVQMEYNFGNEARTAFGEDAIASDIDGMVYGLPHGQYRIHDAFFVQHWNERCFYLAFGYTDPESFIDDNRFANSEYTQFASQIFIDEVGLDNVDQRAPIISAGCEPIKDIQLAIVLSSTTKPGSGATKDIWDNPLWDGPFLGGQLEYKAKSMDLEGNYRIFGWSTLYDEEHLSGPNKSYNWGIAFNFDQDMSKAIGIFGRLGYANQDVSPINFDWSTGMQYSGLFPSRPKDIFAIGVGGVQNSPNATYKGMEYHLESYYKLYLGDTIALTPMFMYVPHPMGASDSSPVIQGLLRIEINFKTAS